MSIIERLFGTSRRASSPEIDAIVDRLVKATDKRLAFVKGYRDALRAPVLAARERMSGDALELARRRIVAVVLIGWVPLLVLALAQGDAWGGGIAVPFIKDVEAHVRFLVAVPLLVAAELLVHM